MAGDSRHRDRSNCWYALWPAPIGDAGKDDIHDIRRLSDTLEDSLARITFRRARARL
ncbi:hypothetical protein [Thauera sp.]|uniref:hypothetical protein n=1 Tax=Thauera sp. TaxID=1905334 RepID=UPI002C06670C|nr:hypothetical protein [Thauera sp.]HRP22799.1 hypothetical protein [Thauera sp.]